MYVCLCYGVTEAQVREAIGAGIRDLAGLARRTQAGTDCGQCRGQLDELMDDVKSELADAERGQGRT